MRLGEKEVLGIERCLEVSKDHRQKRCSHGLCKTLPGISQIGKTMHDRSHLSPHGGLHGYLRLVVLRTRLATLSSILSVRGGNSNSSRIWNGIVCGVLVIVWWVILRVLAGGAADRNRGNTVDEIAGLLLYGFSFVILGRTGSAIMTA